MLAILGAMKKYKKSPVVIVTIILLAVLILGGVFYVTYEQKDSISPWNTYANSDYGFSIQYPSGWEVSIEQDPAISRNGEFSFYLAQQLRSKPPIIDGVEVDPPCAIYVSFFPRIVDNGQQGPTNPKILQFDQYAEYFFKDRGGITSTTTLDGISGFASGETYLFPYKNDAIMFYWEGYDMKEGVDVSRAQIDQHESTCKVAYDHIISTFKFTN